MSIIAPYLILGQCDQNPDECGAEATVNSSSTATTNVEGQPTPGGQPGESAPPKKEPSMMPSVMLMVAIIGIFYFVGIRPQKKQADKQRKLQGALKKGDHVITASGILGEIHKVDDNVVTLEVAKNTRIKIVKSQIGGLQIESSE